MPAPPDPDAEGEEDNSRTDKKDEHVRKEFSYNYFQLLKKL